MLKLLNTIPVNIWSVVLGSIIAFGGVLISNWSQSRRLKIQLKHDAQINAIDRKSDLRKEVYLSAAEELVRANYYLGALTQIDFTKTNIGDGLQDFFASAAKLSLVAEEDTGKHLNELIVAYSDVLFKLMAYVMPISDLRNKVKIINEHYENTQTEIQRILAEMRRYNESCNQDDRIFGVLDSSFKFQQKSASDLSNERNQCLTEITENTKRFSIQLMEEMKTLSMLQAPVMVGIRKELDINTNIGSYKALIASSTERVKEQLDNFLINLNKNA